MIKVDRVEAFNLEGAIRGMRNPHDSHYKSDSGCSWDDAMEKLRFHIGVNDLALAKNLVAAGTEHGKFMRQIFVSMDITAPLYWWKEMDTYKIGTTANSESTMHTLLKKAIDRSCFSIDSEFTDPQTNMVCDQTAGYGRVETKGSVSRPFNAVIEACESLRKAYLDTKDVRFWRALIQLLPESWNQKRTWTANYEVLANIIKQRSNHKLSEWRDFCDILHERCPYIVELCS